MSDLRSWFPQERYDEEVARLLVEIHGGDADPITRAIRCLAMMTKNAPSYGTVVLPFALAHQEACVVLAVLQEQGVEAAR